jgi:hypothetical protein
VSILRWKEERQKALSEITAMGILYLCLKAALLGLLQDPGELRPQMSVIFSGLQKLGSFANAKF